ncbi:MAG: fucose isomerase [Bryobacterales bacterium]|nr:fucose isomerase [Bryobacterales bacterium]
MFEPVILVASGDLRASANCECWAAQQKVEEAVTAAIRREGGDVRRGHPYQPGKGHGFIDSQKYGMEVFRQISPQSPLMVVEAVWQYSHHVLPGLWSHSGPILTVANWSGEWPGLVGMLNLNGCLAKAGIPYSTLWSEEFTDEYFLNGLRRWLHDEPVAHDQSHVRSLNHLRLPDAAAQLGAELAAELRQDKAILGIFDEGCMGMYNAIIPDELLHDTGVFKERLSQSALYAEMLQVSGEEARSIYTWLLGKGLRFVTGDDPELYLTEDQILGQCKMYIAALRIADRFGCDAIGIQYQQGLKDLAPASDLVEGLLNNVDRPPVADPLTGRILYEGRALPHFNEVDECAGLDALVTNRIWRKLGFDPETTLHDVRYGENYRRGGKEEFIWVFEISGAVPPRHLTGGYAGAVSYRQPAMYFPSGGGTLAGVSKPGEVVWSRVFVESGALKADLGRATAVELPDEESRRRAAATTPQWPMMHAVMHGITRDQFMGRHKANHIQVAYAPDAAGANLALAAKAAMFRELGMDVFVCGTENGL